MKIEQKKLETFLNKVAMDKSQQITECVFDFEEKGLKIGANSPPKQARISGLLKANAFKEFEQIGKLGVDNLQEFINVIKRFKGNIKVKHEGNLLTLKGSEKEVDITLADLSFISTDTTEPNLEFQDTFELPEGKILDIFSDVGLNTDSVITIQTEEKKVLITNTGKYKFRHSLDAPTCKGGALSKFGEPLIDAINRLSGKLEISIATEYPLKVLEKTDDSVITVIIAPRANEE